MSDTLAPTVLNMALPITEAAANKSGSTKPVGILVFSIKLIGFVLVNYSVTKKNQLHIQPLLIHSF